MSELHPWLSPWVMEDLRPDEWRRIAAHHNARMREANDGSEA